MGKKGKSDGMEFWQELVAVYYDFCKNKFGEKPSFDGSAPRDLKSIVLYLKARCVDKGVEWTLKSSASRLGAFLDEAYKDRWLRDNWLLTNLNRQKDKIIFNASKQKQQDNSRPTKVSGIEWAISQAIGGPEPDKEF